MAALQRAARQGNTQLCSRLGALTQQQARSFSSLSLPSWWQPQETATPSAAAQGGTTVGGQPWQRATGLLPSLCDVLYAVPKKKVSPHRRGNRNATKYIRWVPVVSQCSKCKRVFQQHQVPHKCEHEECPAYSLRARPSE